MDQISKDLLASYRQHGGINHMDGPNLPSRKTVDALAEDFMRLLFPGFFDRETVSRGEFERSLEERVLLLRAALSGEIQTCLRFAGHESPESAGESEANHVLSSLSCVRAWLRTDVEAAYNGDPAARSFEEIILAYPCIPAIAIQRVAHVLYQREIPLLPRMLTEHAHRLTGIDIHPGATIGSHFFIDHGTGVVIGETATLGSHVKLYQGVTLGAKSFKVDESGKVVKGIKRHPDIGDHVTIYAGATILGGETVIGENTIIGAGVWLMESIPPHSIAYYQGDNLVVRHRRKKEQAEESS